MRIELTNYHKFYEEYKELVKKYKCGIAVTQNSNNLIIDYAVVDDNLREVHQFKKIEDEIIAIKNYNKKRRLENEQDN